MLNKTLVESILVADNFLTLFFALIAHDTLSIVLGSEGLNLDPREKFVLIEEKIIRPIQLLSKADCKKSCDIICVSVG